MTRDDKITELLTILKEARKRYYAGDPILTDEEFEKLEEELKRVDPRSSYFQQVGAKEEEKEYPLRSGILHEVPMRSMRKIKKKHDAVHWIDKRFIGHPVDLIIEPKIDGFSTTVKYNNGKFIYMATRGNGTEGINISHIGPYMEDIPKVSPIEDQFEVRGEIYIPKDTEFDVARERKTLKNIAVGISKRLDGREDSKYLNFVAYDTVDLPFTTEEEKLLFLKDIFPNVIVYDRVESAEDVVRIHDEYETKLRKSLPYEIDGIIVKINDISLQEQLEDGNLHHSNYAMAYKFEAKRYQTRLLTVEWDTGPLGKVTPIAIFEPINIDGKNIQRASLGSRKKFDNLQLSIGDIIEVGLAGDVIPHIYMNATRNIENL